VKSLNVLFHEYNYEINRLNFQLYCVYLQFDHTIISSGYKVLHDRMINDFKEYGSDHGLIQSTVLSAHLSGGNKENHEKSLSIT
jgi:hypothetical protein